MIELNRENYKTIAKQLVKNKSILSMNSAKLNDPPCNFEFKM